MGEEGERKSLCAAGLLDEFRGEPEFGTCFSQPLVPGAQFCAASGCNREMEGIGRANASGCA